MVLKATNATLQDKGISDKGQKWLDFVTLTLAHIENYSVPQYGPTLSENTDVTSTEDCLKYIAKYLRRHGSDRRGRIEELRDLVKIAHFAQFAFDMMEPTEEEIKAIMEGRR